MSSKPRRDKKIERKKIIRRLSDVRIPPTIFRNTRLTVLESIINYLKEDKELSFHEIGVLLGRDERNIWTVFNRALNKK